MLLVLDVLNENRDFRVHKYDITVLQKRHLECEWAGLGFILQVHVLPFDGKCRSCNQYNETSLLHAFMSRAYTIYFLSLFSVISLNNYTVITIKNEILRSGRSCLISILCNPIDVYIENNVVFFWYYNL